MKATYLLNTNLREKYDQYHSGDLMLVVGDIDVANGDDLTVCERAFEILNRDDRPFAQEAYSMSVGDAVCLHDSNGHRYYACNPAGFMSIDPPNELVVDNVREYLHKLVDEINARYEGR